MRLPKLGRLLSLAQSHFAPLLASKAAEAICSFSGFLIRGQSEELFEIEVGSIAAGKGELARAVNTRLPG